MLYFPTVVFFGSFNYIGDFGIVEADSDCHLRDRKYIASCGFGQNINNLHDVIDLERIIEAFKINGCNNSDMITEDNTYFYIYYKDKSDVFIILPEIKSNIELLSKMDVFNCLSIDEFVIKNILE